MLVNIMQVISVPTGEESQQIILDTGAVIQGILLFCMHPFFLKNLNLYSILIGRKSLTIKLLCTHYSLYNILVWSDFLYLQLRRIYTFNLKLAKIVLYFVFK